MRITLGRLVWLTILLRLPSLAIPFWNKDEGWNAARAISQAAGGKFYIDAYDHKTPLLYYLHGWVFSCVAGQWRMFVIRCLLIAAIVGTGCGIYAIAKRLAGARAGLAAFFLFTVFQLCWVAAETNYAGTENFMNCALVWAAAMLLAKRDLFAGALVGIGILFRNSALPDLFVMAAYLLLDAVQYRAWRRNSVRLLQIVVGCAIPCGIVLAYLYASGTLGEAIFWNVDMVRLVLSQHPLWQDVVAEGLRKTGMIVASWALLFTLAGATIYRVSRPLAIQPGIYPALWLMSGIAGIIAGGRFSTHYYFQLLPALSVLAGMALDRSFAAWTATRARRWGIAVAVGLPLIGFGMEVPYRIANYYGWIGTPPVGRVLAEYVRAQTKPTDRIVVWGYLPQVYYYADRVSATKFHTITHLTGQIRETVEYALDLPPLQKMWADFWREMDTHPPILFIDASRSFQVSGRYMHPPERFPKLQAWLAAAYEPVATIEAAVIYRRLGQSP